MFFIIYNEAKYQNKILRTFKEIHYASTIKTHKWQYIYTIQHRAFVSVESEFKFTFEKEESNKILFFEVLLQRRGDIIVMPVFIKETNNGDAMNYLSE